MGVSGGGEDLENVILDRQERDIESSSSEIVDDNLGFGPARSVKTVGCNGVSISTKGSRYRQCWVMTKEGKY